MSLRIQEFFDKATSTLTYIVSDSETRDAVVIDPVWDYDPNSSKLTTTSFEAVKNFVQRNELKLHFVLETHAHADHLTSAQHFKKVYSSVQLGIGERIRTVQESFQKIYNFGSAFKIDGSAFDRLFADNEEFTAGSMKITTLFTPGHTPACVTYLIGTNAFTGDALFMPDYGTGRCDFPDGSAEVLYDSIFNRLYKLPDSIKTYTGHDYQPNGRELRFQSTIGEQKKSNIHLNQSTSKEEFVRFRTERDKTLSAPRLLLPSIQINIQGGRIPPPEANGRSFLKIPLFF